MSFFKYVTTTTVGGLIALLTKLVLGNGSQLGGWSLSRLIEGFNSEKVLLALS